MVSIRFVVSAALLGLSATLMGCAEEDTRLFDETGVWTLENYSLDGGPFVDIAQNRKNRFLLRFKPDDNVVAAAACHEQGTDVDVNGSNCTNAGLSEWTCQCFAYTYDKDRMVWQEFDPGQEPPHVDPPMTSGETEGEPTEGSHELFVSAVAGTTSTYEFASLPLDLFNSDGQLSRHVFQIKAESVWTKEDLDDDGIADLEACSQSCFPSEAPTGG
jgi:hypothetical protein